MKTRRYARRVAYVAVGSGVVLAVWVGMTLWRGDPITGAYATYRQRALAAELDAAMQRREAAARATVPARAAVPEGYRVREGRAWGRILIPRIGVSAVVIQGTRRGDLESGPGHYRITSFPGRGRTVAIAGHRTTFGAWFRHIDALRRGDRIILEMPYGSFRYRVTGYRVVTPKTWSVIANRGYDRLVLSACHPLYSASHRWVVFAKLAPRA